MPSSHEKRSRPRSHRVSGDRVLTDAVRGAGWWLVPLVLLTTLGALATLALPALLGRAVDQLVTTAARSGAPTWSAAGDTLTATAALVGFVVVSDVVSQLVSGSGTAVTTGRLRRRLADHVLAAGPDLARRTPEGDLVARLVGSTSTAARTVVVVAGLASAVIPPAGAVVALAVVDPWLALTFVVGLASVSGVVSTYLRGAHAATAGYLQAQGTIAARLVDALAGARSIGAARTTEAEVDRVLAPLGALRAQGTAVWANIARLAFRGEPVVLLTQVAVIGVAGARLAAGQLSPGELLAAGRYAVMAAGIGGMLDDLGALSRARAASQRVAEVLAVPATPHGSVTTPGGSDEPCGRCGRVGGEGPGTLELRNVTVGPVGSPILDGLDLVVPGGSVVALVGRSGSGKSLVAAVAGRLCDPMIGDVLLDGVPLRSLDRAALRRAVTFAFERPGVLTGTVADAIRFGVDVPPADRVRAASVAARADRFVARLPAGYAALLSETPLSGGELQRIGLARALAHEARVLVLDDATSSLDTATEAEITEAVAALEGRTRLVVTHRRATAARADLVAWLDAGRIRACAPHADLWSDPAYRSIFQPAAPSSEPRPTDDRPLPSAAAPTPAGPPIDPTTRPGPTVVATAEVDTPVDAGAQRGAERPAVDVDAVTPSPDAITAEVPMDPGPRTGTEGPAADVGAAGPGPGDGEGSAVVGGSAETEVVAAGEAHVEEEPEDEPGDPGDPLPVDPTLIGAVDVRTREPRGAGGVEAVVVAVGSPATAGSE